MDLTINHIHRDANETTNSLAKLGYWYFGKNELPKITVQKWVLDTLGLPNCRHPCEKKEEMKTLLWRIYFCMSTKKDGFVDSVTWSCIWLKKDTRDFSMVEKDERLFGDEMGDEELKSCLEDTTWQELGPYSLWCFSVCSYICFPMLFWRMWSILNPNNPCNMKLCTLWLVSIKFCLEKRKNSSSYFAYLHAPCAKIYSNFFTWQDLNVRHANMRYRNLTLKFTNPEITVTSLLNYTAFTYTGSDNDKLTFRFGISFQKASVCVCLRVLYIYFSGCWCMCVCVFVLYFYFTGCWCI